MIELEKTSVTLKFGTGDIGVYSATTEIEKREVVAFKNQEPRDIGSCGDIAIGSCDMSEFDVIMSFDKVESVDVVVRALLAVRDKLLEE